MRPCNMAGGCHHEATITVRLAGIGDRSLCTEHYDWCVSVGMDLRVLEPNAFVPRWRQQNLARDLSRQTGVA